MSSESFTNAYLLTAGPSGTFTTTEAIAGGADISSPTTGPMLFGDPLTFTDPYNSVTLLYDGAVFEGTTQVGIAAIDPYSGATYLFSDNTIPADTTLTIDVGDPGNLCFVGGTLIATPAGPRLVQDLAAGDLVLTADGAAAPVRWIGRQSVNPGPETRRTVFPVRICAGALGANLPTRDLLVSPDHGLMLDGTLVHAAALVDGVGICADYPTEPFTYFHLELDRHALVLAEGVACETYADRAARAAFDNFDAYLTEFGGAEAKPHMDAPRAKSPRQVPYSVRARIAA